MNVGNMNNEPNGNGGALAAFAACASCKFQRRRCGADCFLRPYFPAERYKDFELVHKLYGVRNLVNLLRAINPDWRAREVAVATIVREAWIRHADPVRGSLGVVHNLLSRLSSFNRELEHVRQQLEYHRHREQQRQQQQLKLRQVPPSTSELQELTRNNDQASRPNSPNKISGAGHMNGSDPGSTSYVKHLQSYGPGMVPNTSHQNMEPICVDSEESSAESAPGEDPPSDHVCDEGDETDVAGPSNPSSVNGIEGRSA
ncbi:hypothetical protein IFM89_015706 [Coptis chinensis]|uniref:LOB domain-containing protein n=1 Tax=Coptis chinensis TaxID=261450 RepID=A0A835LZM6_9MAGN|nr:hypothetical protein IFM89_015706 [Coptis chinensis]